MHREKAALAEQVLQKSLDLQQAKPGGSVSAEASSASEQVLLQTTLQCVLYNDSMTALHWMPELCILGPHSRCHQRTIGFSADGLCIAQMAESFELAPEHSKATWHPKAVLTRHCLQCKQCCQRSLRQQLDSITTDRCLLKCFFHVPAAAA